MAKRKSAKKRQVPVRAKTAGAAKRKQVSRKGVRAKGSKLPARATEPKQAGAIHLTPREREILRLVSLGCTVKEAAAVLDVAPSTADNHKARLMAKLRTDKAALLTRLAIKMGITSMHDQLTATEKRRSGRRQDGWN